MDLHFVMHLLYKRSIKKYVFRYEYVNSLNMNLKKIWYILRNRLRIASL